MELQDKILALMKQQGAPMTAGEVEKALKVDRKEVDKAFKQLKKEEAIVSPVRCKWEPAKK
ncbi:MAG: transcriptional regulator [Acetobacterium sp.]|uniref:transcriptional regulator n=1 Tax=Acetobacterium sp. TaxID=1872094 RepID=UPI001B5F05B6|nr:transcriptional regulator [Acetobacterium sp.]